MSEFKIPPISTLAGSTFINYFKILRKGRILPKYYFKIFLTTLIILIASPFHFWEKIVYRNRLAKFKFEKQPLFILGHWRSGTTLLHNILSKDPATGFVSTYQSVFPTNLSSKWIFKTFMKINMPSNRPSDKVELNINFPQEDEFAFSNLQSNAYYNFFYFPENYKEFYEKAVLHKNLSEKEIKRWFKEYDALVKKAVINTNAERVVIKNPVNTGRIDKILKLYPDAKFVYIYRNPITVFYSTKRFFEQLFPTLWFHEVDNTFIDKMIFDVYQDLMKEYEKQKSLIPPENLIEIKFEEFEIDPVLKLKEIYTKLLNEDFSEAKYYFSSYFDTQKSHKKNKYHVSKTSLDLIRKYLNKYIEMNNYGLPEDVIVDSEK